MMFIKHTEDYKMEEVPQSLFAAMGEFVGEQMKNGTIIDTAGLQPTAKGKRVRLSGGKLSVLDGPFVETREVVGGYALVEAKSDEEALALATRFMDLHRIHWPAFSGECELRPLEAMEPNM
ncbi:MAG TPA: YciI family protein [Terriglobia bacterium]|nr:YciI family protein [Terriglobia bacterium]